MATGPISYMTVVEYAREIGLGPGEREFLWDVLKRLDTIYLKIIQPPKPQKGK